ncbi:MAG: gamma-D-glutamyl-meso-diaminopimelate peptidase [Ruminococcaceae bacterium]|nr:gamma-D-glutamyl-meso-diaminopimelate peptidase [Oscillospiraceae bacterium]
MKNERNSKITAPERLTPTDHETLIRHLDYLTERYPFISVSFLGTSILGRSIPIVSIGKEGAPSVLYVAAHHGMEWICSAALLKFIEDVSSAYEKGKKVFGISTKVLFETRLIQIVPMLNPDGVELQINGLGKDSPLAERLLRMNGGESFEKWQANARGVDLNHNYDAGFSEYKKLEKEAGILSGCSTRFSGEFPESEPETGALCNYIRWNKNIKAALTLHTQGEEIYCSAKGDMARKCKNMGKLLEKFTGYKLASPETMACYGGMTDWMVDKMKIPSFTLECGKGENPLPESELFPIYMKLREALFTFPILV